MKTYTIPQKNEPFSWDAIPTLSIDTLLWSPEVPITAQAQICYDNNALYIRLSAAEQNIRAEETGPLGAPCEDSCLEFFFCPDPADSRYFNIEFNPVGCIYLGFGGPYGLVRLLPEDVPIQPKTTRTAEGWSLEYGIPYTFIRQFFPGFSPAPGKQIRANCYKCGDSTAQPHFLSWNPVDLPNPCFHCPQFFGTMTFQ